MNHRVFVYGSLKRDFYNNWFLTESRFVGDRLTQDETFVMCSLGGFPGVIKSFNGGEGASIYGELYEVDDHTLTRLDMLESNGRFYNRELVGLRDETDPAWMYILMGKTGNRMYPTWDGDHIYYRW
jgi:gamma-glutamylcyclotransferase (GGCT)/AIG2-like uncharacterized protein YtfP